MARTTSQPPEELTENIIDIDVSEEMRGSFLEYAYSVIYQRALPDARDGLKPVQRRILYQMNEMGLRPDRAHVKCARVVGEVMGKLHPHGDSPIYDALVRLSQPFAMRVPLVDGHGNFGSLGGDDAPAAMRYTEARLNAAARLMVSSIDENVVDFRPNYDGQETEPEVLPAAFPNLLVNGASGIAVGMATNMAPHNLGEVIAAARHLIAHPDATLDDLMEFVPGPDLPTGGTIVGLDGIRDAYVKGRGTFRTRATVAIDKVTPRRTGLIVTELPYNVGPEKVVSRIKELVQAKKLQGIADLKDLTDRNQGLRLVIELKNGFNPEAVLEELYRLTPMEESFGINNVALVDGQPQTLGLRELLSVYVAHRLEVVRRRCEFRRAKREERLHLVAGLLVALLNIDEVIALIRDSEDTAQARQRLMTTFELSDTQARYILDTPLRRLTKYDRMELETERDQLSAEIAELTAILESDTKLRKLVSRELAEVAKEYATPRRTVLMESSGVTRTSSVPLEVGDDPCHVLLSSTGMLGRSTGARPPRMYDGPRTRHDATTAALAATVRGEVALVTDLGRLIRLPVLELPELPDENPDGPPLQAGVPVTEFVELAADERVISLAAPTGDGPGLVVGTRQGIVKRVAGDYPQNKDEFEVIALRDGDRLVGATQLVTGEEDLVFVTSDAQLLRFSADGVRPQGRSAGGVAGVRLSEGAHALWFGAVTAPEDSLVLTVAGSSATLPDTQTGAAKLTPFQVYPAKGRATGGVRCHRFLKGEDVLLYAWVGRAPARASRADGGPVRLPDPDGRRDGSGEALPRAITAVGTGQTSTAEN
ncbi:DNA gyrase/topoisomerase IV subunit A [Marinitenerispora sediminis]|uniref:DNA topoisomerase (ATP-hydrolyzing) n=1 Tax=Marinitenerispora sediminis TaxID=1931232 RepID=A0A368TAQ5_9ACTN|nr:DNA topoisomerase IV subunit A [Marinitenerispora sediminis]RCV56986.1 DNA topoisomerase IV [Marinitenerispora sediminis]RCV60191.1 DNA topoisomerase IV [Marinitenerispora sediminis]RCV62102.1 DNA topoisomerase IV [Marinitenerispora sediminis]